MVLLSQVDLAHLEGEVEKRRQAIEEAKAQARGQLPVGAPVLDGGSGFSPGPKPGECQGRGSEATVTLRRGPWRGSVSSLCSLLIL